MVKFKLILFFLFSVVLIIYAQTTPDFEDGVFIQANGTDLVIGDGTADTAPCVTDWNNDGLKDLLVGQNDFGKIRLYLNSGTNSSPVFTNYTFIQADGNDITLPYG